MNGEIDNDKQLEAALNSLEGMQRMPADPLMYDKVMSRLAEGTMKNNKVRILLPRIAAAAAVLILINVASIFHFAHKPAAAEHNDISQVITEDMSALSDNNF